MPKKATIFLLITLLLVTYSTVYAVPQQPHTVEGIVLIEGTPAVDGTVVVAKIDGTPLATTTTQTFNNTQGVYFFNIPADDPDTTAVEGGSNGDIITFEVDGNPAYETTPFQIGGFNSLDLTADGSDAPPPLDAAFVCTPTSGNAPLTVTCNDQSTGNPTSWQWDFGDGNTSTDQNPTHTFTALGSHIVQLTISNGTQYDTVTQTISTTTSDMSVSILPTAITVYATSTFVVDLHLNNADGVYGTEAICTFDGNLLSREFVAWPFFFDANGFSPIVLEDDIIKLAAAQQHPAPALSGNNKIGELEFAALSSGETDLHCAWQLFNKDGQEIANGIATTTVTIEQPDGDINGTVIYQLRSPHNNISMYATGSEDSGSAETDSGGAFAISPLQQGDYTLDISAIGHVIHCEYGVLVEAGEQTILDPIRLRAGDTDNDGDVDLSDAIAVSGVFATDTNDLSIDFNGNGRVDGGDLTALGGNYGLVTNCGS